LICRNLISFAIALLAVRRKDMIEKIYLFSFMFAIVILAWQR
jgi:hypothetical protein